MHLVPADRAALGEPGAVAAWADRFSLLGDPGRLSLLLCIWRAGPISVTDLAVATGMNDTTVSQALRLLRTAGLVAPQRDGRIVRYAIADQTVLPILALASPPDSTAISTAASTAISSAASTATAPR
jgi:DNA-binding transcriptional ArsR family regulator